MVIGYNLYTAIDHRLERMEQVTTSRWCTTVLSMETCRYGGVGVLVWKYAGGMEVWGYWYGNMEVVWKWGIGMKLWRWYVWRCGVLVWKYAGMEAWGIGMEICRYGDVGYWYGDIEYGSGLWRHEMWGGGLGTTENHTSELKLSLRVSCLIIRLLMSTWVKYVVP